MFIVIFLCSLFPGAMFFPVVPVVFCKVERGRMDKGETDAAVPQGTCFIAVPWVQCCSFYICSGLGGVCLAKITRRRKGNNDKDARNTQEGNREISEGARRTP